MVAEPIWLSADDVREIHDDQIAVFGGLPGEKDFGLIESAVHAPVNLYLYQGESDVLRLGVHLCHALVRNHGFLDGNKRTAAVAMIEFVAINGYLLMVPDDDAEQPILGRWVEAITAGDLSEAQLYARLAGFMRAIAG
ncbi:type II toxin-antitoxin system death-on-curing family toxin [Sphingomonas sp. AX6]|uniref:type II toxin-antitoxin system death-on-curing family toxin n=1 Tax=Sphingomonas sp. AX6 TaxID=2653171 RepID=UPI0012F23849|nr:type II toxin-antitoxin system death-on-curing family toxin [Sphingomonas sp. AX6]VXC87783.1 putative Toxin Doc [Sphingomonas sp. AX6]